MKDIRPMWSTTVDPSEYDIDGQMEDFVKAANKAKECYYGIDVGKLWGLYKSFKSQTDELATLRAQLAEAREALELISYYKNYSTDGEVKTGYGVMHVPDFANRVLKNIR